MQKPEDDPRSSRNGQEITIDKNASGNDNIKELLEDLRMEQLETM